MNGTVTVPVVPWYRKPEILLTILLSMLWLAQGIIEAAPSVGIAVSPGWRLVLVGLGLASTAVKGILQLAAPDTRSGIAALDKATPAVGAGGGPRQ